MRCRRFLKIWYGVNGGMVSLHFRGKSELWAMCACWCHQMVLSDDEGLCHFLISCDGICDASARCTDQTSYLEISLDCP